MHALKAAALARHLLLRIDLAAESQVDRSIGYDQRYAIDPTCISFKMG
jgi:dTDP-D-glucose 4,6-dehydratase